MSAPALRRDPARLIPPRLAEALFEATPGGLLVTDRRGTIQWADRCFARWCGSDEDGLHGTDVAWVMPGAWKVLRGVRDRTEMVIDTTVRPPRGPARTVRVHAARSGRRGSGPVVWFISEDGPVAPATTTPGRHESAAPSADESFHLDALRLLHELASAPRDGYAAVKMD